MPASKKKTNEPMFIELNYKQLKTQDSSHINAKDNELLFAH